jgi:hypothetical protein
MGDEMSWMSQEAILERLGFKRRGRCSRQKRRVDFRYNKTVLVDGKGFEWVLEGEDLSGWILRNTAFSTFTRGTWIKPPPLD